MRAELKFITVADGELFVTHIDGVLSTRELCAKSWAILMLGLAQFIQLMGLEAQVSQFGWRMSTVEEMKIH